MTLLVGVNTPTTGATSASFSSGNAYGGQDSFNVASATGIVTSLNIYINAASGTATLIYLGLYDSGGNLLCGGSASLTTGLNTISIGGGPTVNSGTQYHIVAQA